MWVSNSGSPLHTHKLCYALGVRMGIADENIPEIRTILECSFGPGLFMDNNNIHGVGQEPCEAEP